MTRMKVSEITDKVRICIDEIAHNDAEFTGDQDNSEMETVIREKIPEAVRYVMTYADAGLVEPDTVYTKEKNADAVKVGGDLVGRIALPERFLRVCYARFASWPLYVSDVIRWDGGEYAMLGDPYVTCTWERPGIAVVPSPAGGRTLELYRAREAGEDFEVGIVTEPDTGTGGGDAEVSMPLRLVPALVYYLAGLTLMTYNERRADDMFNQALLHMGAGAAHRSAEDARTGN